MSETSAADPSQGAAEGIFFIDRRSGEKREEVVYGRGFMEFFYGNPLGGCLTGALLSRRWLSWIYGKYNDSRFSRRKIPGFIAALDLDMNEVVGELEDFETFNDFFARHLKPEARPIAAEPDAFISPADARLHVFPAIDGDTLLPVKGAKIPVPAFLEDAAMAERYRGGSAMIFRLCPSDYHRFHFPASGVPSKPRSLPGRYHSVSPFALEKGIDVFCKNHRVVTELVTESYGRIVMVDVAALCVGAIKSTFTAEAPVERGAAKGFFKFGGSTVVVLCEAGRLEIDEDLIANTAAGTETLVKFGERLGTLNAA